MAPPRVARRRDVGQHPLRPPYLDALARAFAKRDVRAVTAKELHAFHQEVRATPAVAPVLALLEKKSQRWEPAYSLRERGVVELLQWESPRPVRALVELFDAGTVRPQRVLSSAAGTA